MKKILTIAGSDCSGGAGIQADIKTITMHGMYAMSAITALTAQNTTGVYGIMNSSADFLKNQIDCIFNDIRPDAVKIGMVSDVEIIEAIAQKLKEYKAVNIVADPVMVATSGSRLISEDATDALMTRLLPLADIITPNLAEAEVLTGMKITTREEMEKAAKVLSDKLPSTVGIVIKGGHLDDTVVVMRELLGVILQFPRGGTLGLVERLSGLIREKMNGDVRNGDVYIFINRLKNRIKLLHAETGGLVMYEKLLEEGTFKIPAYDPETHSYPMTWSDLVIMVEGINEDKRKGRQRP